jgi:putative oxidoreductase
MKSIFSTTFPISVSHLSLLAARLLVGSFMLTHGLPKLTKLFDTEKISFADPFGLGPVFSLTLTVMAEFLCSILIMLGLGTRLASALLIITMLVAAFHVHLNDPFGLKEKALLYVVIYLMLLVFGSGKYSIDHILTKKT